MYEGVVFALKLGSKWGLFSRDGRWITDMKFDFIDRFLEENALALDGKYGFINRLGEWTVPPIFDDITEFSDEFIIGIIGGKCGLYDVLKQTWLFEPIYDEIKYTLTVWFLIKDGKRIETHNCEFII